MPKALITSLFLIIITISSHAESLPWEEYLISLYGDDEQSVTAMQEAHEYLSTLAAHPLDINTVGPDELSTIPGLNQQQINDIISYRTKYGKFKSMDELNMIPSLDLQKHNFLTVILMVLPPKSITLAHEINAFATVPTYYRAGDGNNYLGDAVKHTLRYSLSIGNNIRFNLTGAKAAGEPFFTNGNNFGYDRYAYNLSFLNIPFSHKHQSASTPVLKHAIIGTYKAQFGMGLTMNNSFTLSKQSSITSAARTNAVFSPHSSAASTNYLQGAAATIAIRKFTVSAFLSYRYIDATLNTDSTIATILTSSTHRTASEMSKKNNSAILTTGAHIALSHLTTTDLQYSIGASLVFSHLNRPINPIFSNADTISDSRLYRLYYPTGKNFLNTSIDYSLRYSILTFEGETAISDNAQLATINRLSLSLSKLTLTAQQRFYSYRYTTLYGMALNEGGRVQNESGGMLSAKWSPTKKLTIDAYTDLAYFPWMRYRIPEQSTTWDNAITLTYKPSLWSIATTYRLKTKSTQQPHINDFPDANTTSHRLRIIASLTDKKWSARSQLEGCIITNNEKSKGIIISQSLGYKPIKTFSIYASTAYFNTTDYDARLYSYERGMQYSFSYNSFYGNGMRFSLLLHYDISPHIAATLKTGTTKYFDRSIIGTADQRIFSSSKTDIDIQLKIKL